MEKVTLAEYLLAFAGVALMMVTVVIAVIAIYGYFEIKKQLRDIAQETAQNSINDYLSNNEKNIQKMIIAAVKTQSDKLYNANSTATKSIDKQEEQSNE